MKQILLTLALTALCVARNFAAPLGTAFTYQGRLNDGGAPATGSYDMIFNLYDDPTNGNVLGSFSIFAAVPVTNGLFTVDLNSHGEFGPEAFNGQARWLQIGVRTNNNNALNPWINLSPRQPLNCAPQAMFAANVADGAITGSKLANGTVQSNNLAAGAVSWNAITGIPAGFADGVDNGAFYTAGPGLNLSWVNQFSVNFAGSGSAASVAHSDHGHFGDGWGGSASFDPGLSVTNSAGNGVGLYGQQGAGSGFPYLFGNVAGVWGESSQGNGVWGASATTAGVRGISLGTNGYGVYGATITTNGTNSGVAGQSASTSGVGVRGQATAKTGETIGVRGESASGEGAGVMGLASALWGEATGVHGESAAVHGTGVFGKATYVSGVGANYGVVGQSDSLWGYGVYGHAASPSGINYGVVGESHSLGGVGVVARNTNGASFKAEGTGIIQSDADSYIFIPGTSGIGWNNDAAVERDARRLIVNDFWYSGNVVHFPISLPGMLYGQSVVLKSITIVYKCPDPDYGFVSQTRLVESIYPETFNVLIDDSTTHFQSHTYTLNHYLGNTAGFLTLEMVFDTVPAEGHVPSLEVYGIRVRLGHK